MPAAQHDVERHAARLHRAAQRPPDVGPAVPGGPAAAPDADREPAGQRLDQSPQLRDLAGRQAVELAIDQLRGRRPGGGVERAETGGQLCRQLAAELFEQPGQLAALQGQLQLAQVAVAP